MHIISERYQIDFILTCELSVPILSNINTLCDTLIECQNQL